MGQFGADYRYPRARNDLRRVDDLFLTRRKNDAGTPTVCVASQLMLQRCGFVDDESAGNVGVESG